MNNLPEHNTLTEGIQRIYQFQFSITAQSDHLVHFLKFVGYDTKAGHELVETLFAEVVVMLALLVPARADLVQL